MPTFEELGASVCLDKNANAAVIGSYGVRGAGRLASKAMVPLAIGMDAYDGYKDSGIVGGAATAAGGYLGAAKGAALGASIGSVVPVVGTAIGGLAGGLGGWYLGSQAGKAVGRAVAGKKQPTSPQPQGTPQTQPQKPISMQQAGARQAMQPTYRRAA